MKYRLTAALIIAMVVAGCSGGGGSDSSVPPVPATATPAEKVASLESSGVIPKLDRGPSIAGTDADANGIRDDIDALIASKYAAGPERHAATQLARALQSTLTVNTTDTVAVKAVANRVTRGVVCVNRKFNASGGANSGRVITEMEGATANTKPRLRAYLAYNKALDGTASSLPEGETCE